MPLAVAVLCGLLFFNLAVSQELLQGQSAIPTPLGIAWNVTGMWQVVGETAAIHTGDAIQPGSLLEPAPSDSDHSITILLPDGQRILYECFTVDTCARGFRVPPLATEPDEFTLAFLVRVRAVMAAHRNSDAAAQPQSRSAKDEAVAVTGPGGQIEVGGLVSALQNGHYTYNVRGLSPEHPLQAGLALDKTARTIKLAVPGPGLYEVTIVDTLKNPRINLLVAAIEPSQDEAVLRPFQKARALLKRFNGEDQGWPIHAFQRAYLESLMLGINPQDEHPKTAVSAERSGVTAEPQFSPSPGVLKGDTSIALQCMTPGATIHFTIDSSQPYKNSQVYQAPIILKRTAITIKAFASAPGKKDSPVVTGFFRIAEE